MSIVDQFPGLFYDIKVVEECDPKPLPSMTELMATVLSKYGINQATVASDLANAAEELVKMRSTAKP